MKIRQLVDLIFEVAVDKVTCMAKSLTVPLGEVRVDDNAAVRMQVWKLYSDTFDRDNDRAHGQALKIIRSPVLYMEDFGLAKGLFLLGKIRNIAMQVTTDKMAESEHLFDGSNFEIFADIVMQCGSKLE